MLPRLRYLVDEFGDEQLTFANRGVYLAHRLAEQKDMLFFHVVDGVEFADVDDTQWLAAKRTFVNPTGWLDGGSACGILLNGDGTAVVNIGRRVTQTQDIEIRDVHIHDLALTLLESFCTIADTQVMIIHRFFLESLDWLRGGLYDESNGKYIGDACTDLLVASNELLRNLFFLDGLRDWDFNETELDLFDLLNIAVQWRCARMCSRMRRKAPLAVAATTLSGLF